MLCITNCFSMWSNGYLTRNLRTEGKIFILLCTKIHNIMLASVPAFVHCVDTIGLQVYPGNIWCLASPKHHHANINCTLQRDCNAGIIPITSGETEAKSSSCLISSEPASLLQPGLQNFCFCSHCFCREIHLDTRSMCFVQNQGRKAFIKRRKEPVGGW